MGCALSARRAATPSAEPEPEVDEFDLDVAESERKVADAFDLLQQRWTLMSTRLQVLAVQIPALHNAATAAEQHDVLADCLDCPFELVTASEELVSLEESWVVYQQ